MFKTRYDYLTYNKMELNCKDINDKEQTQLCIKYDIILPQDFKYLTRKHVIQKIETWTSQKVSKYKSRPRSNSNPNIKSITIPQSQTQVQRQRRMSTQGAPKKHEINYQKTQGPPQSLEPYQRDRRMSHPQTPREVLQAKDNHQMRLQQMQGQQHVQTQLHKPEYDSIGLYPPVRRLIAIGDLHGDLRVTLIALSLAKVIPDTISLSGPYKTLYGAETKFLPGIEKLSHIKLGLLPLGPEDNDCSTEVNLFIIAPKPPLEEVPRTPVGGIIIISKRFGFAYPPSLPEPKNSFSPANAAPCTKLLTLNAFAIRSSSYYLNTHLE